MERMWAGLSPEQREVRSAAMLSGRKKAKARREREAARDAKRQALHTRARTSKETSTIDLTLDLTKKAAALLELAGSREEVTRLLDIAELVMEDRSD
jgi:hypothetical protein